MTSLIRVSLFTALIACTPQEQHDLAQTITITPQRADVLTCSTAQFTAAVTGFDDLQVSWAASPGTIDSTGLYASPTTIQPASVTATSMADPHLTASAPITLATAFPSSPGAIPDSAGTETTIGAIGIFQHQVVASGQRAYAAWPVNPTGSNQISMEVARSDDGGTSWNSATSAIATTLVSPFQGQVECVALAIDQGNPDIVYATARVSGPTVLSETVGVDDGSLAFTLSLDGGRTFAAPTVLRVTTQVGYCADVISPAPDTVVVVDPTDNCAADAYVFSDDQRGATFSHGLLISQNEYEADGKSGLVSIDGLACGNPAKHDLQQNRSTSISGEANESPRLFTDGAGRVCITYIADSTGVSPLPEHTYVQCSDDLGATFSPLHSLDPEAPALTEHSQAVGAFGANHAAAIAWVRETDPAANPGAFLFLATSADNGTTWGPATEVPTYVLPGTTASAPVENPALAYDATGVLWIAYRVYDGGDHDRIVVDKSCDGGLTWSGAVLVNGTEAQITAATFANMKWPVLIMDSGAAPHLAASAGTSLDVIELAP